jgi:hypothetical protein
LSVLVYTRDRLRAFLAEVGRVSESEFPTPHSKAALEALESLFQAKLSRLEVFDDKSNPDVVRQECALSLAALFEYTPLLGFILRSTNVRNAFEMFGPLLTLAGSVLEPGVAQKDRKTRLVISSEWDYSPFTYSQIPDLPDFVLIGLPAPESSNPLLIPLAGHELGHSVWAAGHLGSPLEMTVKTETVKACKDRWPDFQKAFPGLVGVPAADIESNLFAVEAWKAAKDWALRQAQETFCDFLGVRIFDTAFLHAMAYLISPRCGERSVYYPPLLNRVKHLMFAAEAYGVEIPIDYATMFEDDAATYLGQADGLRLSVSDAVLSAVVPELMSLANEVVLNAGLQKPTRESIDQVLRHFTRVVPMERCGSLSVLLNAAWTASLKPDLWKDIPQVYEDRDRVLKELVLKNVELFEIEHILSDTP